MRNLYRLPFIEDFDVSADQHREACHAYLTSRSPETESMDDVHRAISFAGIRDAALLYGQDAVVSGIQDYLSDVFAEDRERVENMVFWLRDEEPADYGVRDFLEQQRRNHPGNHRGTVEDIDADASMQELEYAVTDASTPSKMHAVFTRYAEAHQEEGADNIPALMRRRFYQRIGPVKRDGLYFD